MTTGQLTYFETLLEGERARAARVHEDKKLAAVERALETLQDDAERRPVMCSTSASWMQRQ